MFFLKQQDTVVWIEVGTTTISFHSFTEQIWNEILVVPASIQMTVMYIWIRFFFWFRFFVHFVGPAPRTSHTGDCGRCVNE
jgi:hypothetical protein